MRYSRHLVAVLLSLTASSAFATLITFDDLPANIDIPELNNAGITTPMPLTTQYEHLGVSFGEGDPELVARGEAWNDGAAITDYGDAVVSGTNAIMDFYGPGMSFTFIGDQLPGYVSFNVTGTDGVGIGASAFDADGARIANVHSDGWWGTPELSTPPVPRQLLEFEADNIARIQLYNLFARRGGTQLDNLYFSDTRPVPETAAWPLLTLAMLGLGLSRYRKR